MEQEHPLDQKVNRIAKKLSKLQADYENLAHDNTMLHVGVSHLAIKQQVRLAELPHSELAHSSSDRLRKKISKFSFLGL